MGRSRCSAWEAFYAFWAGGKAPSDCAQGRRETQPVAPRSERGERKMSTRRSVSLAVLLFAALAATTLFVAVPVRGQQRQALPTRLSAPAGIKAVGRLPGSKQLSLALTLRLRNQDGTPRLSARSLRPHQPQLPPFLDRGGVHESDLGQPRRTMKGSQSSPDPAVWR